MVLRVTDGELSEVTIDMVVMSINEFCDVYNHPYIASSKFDKIIIDLDKRIPSEYFKAIIGHTVTVPVISTIDTDSIRQLASLYPEEAAKLRFTFMKEADKVPALIEEMSVKYKWN